MLSLEACNVLSLEAFGTFRYFKFYGLTFVQGLVAVHLNRGEVDKNIFPGLPLDETVTLRSIKPLHCPLFLHFPYLELELLCFSWSAPSGDPKKPRPGLSSARDSLPPQKKGRKVCPRSHLNEQKAIQEQQTLKRW
jgi:hypothetical protein